MLSFFGVLSSKQSLENPDPLSKDPNPNYGLSVLQSDSPVAANSESDATSEVNVPADGEAPAHGEPLHVSDAVVGAPSDVANEVDEPYLHSTATARPKLASNKSALQRLSFRPFPFFHGHKSAPIITHGEEAQERERAAEASKRAFLRRGGPLASSEKRLQEAALELQKVIIGPSAISPSNGQLKAKPVSKTQLAKIRSELTQPKAANRLIAELRKLPMPDSGPVKGHGDVKTVGPIHAVCLQYTDEEIEKKFFSNLKSVDGTLIMNMPSVASASVESLVDAFKELRVVSLVLAPDLGLGQPGDGEGLLAGAVPTPETVANGFLAITPQLMALGYATSQAFLPSHTGVYPPTDRISVVTYWWGLEVVLPHATMKYLEAADNISHALVNLLTALALMNGGVREVLPFVRYMSQFIDFEWSAIRSQDKGKGVVCAATWIMPIALVPRPWDFPDPPSKSGTQVKASLADNTGVEGALPDDSLPIVPEVIITPPSIIRPPKRIPN